MEIRTIEPTNITDLTKKRVAAYARVSSDKDAAENSLESQINYFTHKIAEHPGWVFVSMYADNGISGTKDDRPEFQRMLLDARSGKLDIIITKSITRFARNVVLLLEVMREMTSLGINILFENDHISSMSAQGELLITFLALHAEEQAKSASDNKRWQIRRYFEEGIPTYFRIYGYRMIDNHLEIVPEEAEVIRRIFAMYLDGMGKEAIARTINAEWGNSTKQWTFHSVTEVLKNEKYTGNMLLQKTYRPDFRTKKKMINRGQWAQYLVRDSHEAIIDQKTFEEVQLEIERRQKRFVNKPRIEHQNLFKGIVSCGICGAKFQHKNVREKSSDSHFPALICNTYLTLGKEKCPAKRIRESILIEKTKEVLNLSASTELSRDLILARITAIESATDNRLRFYLKDGSVKVTQWQNPSRRESWTPEMKQKARERSLAQNQARKGEEND
ncbi:recombinase family protein [Candidatus Saccharibacteria bacterium]|nr:recombinase family protein [Candidatus Saccharibacteria bacterium]